MKTKNSGRWQYSLAALMMLVTGAALAFGTVAWVGVSVALDIAAVLWSFRTTYREIEVIRAMDNYKTPRDPDPIINSHGS